MLPLVLSGVFISSLLWMFVGRQESFPDITSRFSSLGTLLTEDRLGFSFCVDLLYFWAFQGWLVDDDAKRRKWEEISDTRGKRDSLIEVAKKVPFFGLAYYIYKRPGLREHI